MGANGQGEYRLSPLAEADLENIWSYTVKNWSWEQAEKYHFGFLRVFDALAKNLVKGRNADIRNGYLKHAVGSHFIYYRQSASDVEIVRILHKRMDVGLHLK